MKAAALVDLAAGIGAIGWALTALWVPQLAELASPEVAGGFAFVALARAYHEARR